MTVTLHLGSHLTAGVTIAALALAIAGGLLLATAARADAPYAAMRPVRFTDVRLDDGFWAPRIRDTIDVMIPHQLKMCEETGRIRNFEIAAGRKEGKFEGIYFNDSDVFKVLEGIAYCYALEPSPSLLSDMDRLVDIIAAAQQPDGYLNTYLTLVEPDKRWSNLDDMHELYCAGTLMEAGVAHYDATGDRKLLDVALRFAEYIWSVFGPGKRDGYCGHEEIEIALVKLTETTGDQRWLELAQRMVDLRGQRHGAEYCQDHVPVREQNAIVGHAVRATYLFSAVADLAARTGDEGLVRAMDAVWDDTVSHKMYITGGIGPSASNEGFTGNYDLPNDTAYAETCAAIGLAFWGKRMTEFHGDARYADVVERALYNGFLSGVSLSGDRYFYVNPLESRGDHHRQDWFGCACCPPNVLRVLPTIGGYMYGVSDAALWVNLYAASAAGVRVGDTDVKVVQRTEYPWDGDIKVAVNPASPAEFEMRLRIPGWCQGAACDVNGASVDASPAVDGYLHIRREWREGDEVSLHLPMPVRRIEANPAVEADRGRVALMRGPIVYCLEAVDNGGAVRDIYLPRESDLTAGMRPDLLGGVVIITGRARRVTALGWQDELYRPVRETVDTTLTVVPYYAWDNRDPGEMTVWIPEAPGLADQSPEHP